MQSGPQSSMGRPTVALSCRDAAHPAFAQHITESAQGADESAGSLELLAQTMHVDFDGFDARIVTATHRRLEARVAEGLFREDLFYRIKGVRVCLPALRERADRATLIEAMLAREAAGGAAPRLSTDAMRALMAYAWPGNIRQLNHVLRLALTLAEGEAEITCEHLPEEVLEDNAANTPSPATHADTGGMCLRELELEAVKATMARCGGNVSAAARSLRVARATLYRKLRLFGLLD